MACAIRLIYHAPFAGSSEPIPTPGGVNSLGVRRPTAPLQGNRDPDSPMRPATRPPEFCGSVSQPAPVETKGTTASKYAYRPPIPQRQGKNIPRRCASASQLHQSAQRFSSRRCAGGGSPSVNTEHRCAAQSRAVPRTNCRPREFRWFDNRRGQKHCSRSTPRASESRFDKRREGRSRRRSLAQP